MPVFNSQTLLDSLTQSVNQTIQEATKLQTLPTAELTHVPAPGKWSIVQIIYHLNSYNDYYLQHIAATINTGNKVKYSNEFRSGVIGNYFANAMLPGNNGKVNNTMKAPKDHTPAPNFTDTGAIAEFIEGQKKLLALLKTARQLNLTKLTVPISISKFIKIRLGDTFRFLIAHQQRHFVQIGNLK